MTELLLGVRLTPSEKMKVIKLSNIDLQEKVSQLRIETAEQTNLPNDAFDLIYCGCLLENETLLESYGLKSGSMIHVLGKKDTKEAMDSSSATGGSEANVEMLASVFKSFVGNPLLELALRRLTKRPDVIENIISSSPRLNEDAVAMTILQDPDLIIHFTNVETMKKIAKLHPPLLEAAQHIASAVHEEAHNFAASSTSLNASTSSAHASGRMYSLDNLSDDEEMAGDSSQSSDSTQPSRSDSQMRPPNQITAQQLMEALSRTRRSTSGEGASGGSGPSPLSRSNSSSGGVISLEMFNQAIQQAFASTPGVNNSATTASTPTSPTPAAAPQNTSQNTSQNASSNDVQRPISLMHEMGLMDDVTNLLALQVTNGDVQAAIELVLNGFGHN